MATTHGIFIVDKRLRILCVHPTGADMETWSIPKGGADEGEDSLSACVRELFEETNLDITPYSDKMTYYESIGCFPYGVRDKKLKAHVMYFDLNLSKLDLDLKCNTLIDNSDKLECDLVEWKDLSFAFRFLHHTQIKALEKIIKTLIRKVD